MPMPCDNCTIRVNCDFLSGMCGLSPKQVVRLRSDLIRSPQMKAAKKQSAVMVSTLFDRVEYQAKRHKRRYIPVEVDRRHLPETTEKILATKKQKKLERMRTALERRQKTRGNPAA